MTSSKNYQSVSRRSDSEEMAQKQKICICTSAEPHNVQAFIDELIAKHRDLDFQYFQLPYNSIDELSIKGKKIDVLILCHSINNRRFAITDVMDALYDKFLPHVASILGENRVGVVVHDFPKEKLANDVNKVEIQAFKHKQPTTFIKSSLQIIGGKLDGPVELTIANWQEVDQFLETAIKSPKPSPSVSIPILSIPKPSSACYHAHKSRIWCAIIVGICVTVGIIVGVYFAVSDSDNSGEMSTTAAPTSTPTPTPNANTTDVNGTTGNRKRRAAWEDEYNIPNKLQHLKEDGQDTVQLKQTFKPDKIEDSIRMDRYQPSDEVQNRYVQNRYPKQVRFRREPRQ